MKCIFVFANFAANSLGLPFIHPYLDSIRANFSHGANFATAASTIRRQNTTFFQSGWSPFSLDVQSGQFIQFKNRSQWDYNRGTLIIYYHVKFNTNH